MKRDALQMYWNHLSDRDKDIITRKMNGETISSIAIVHSLSRSRICNIIDMYNRRKEQAPYYNDRPNSIYHLDLKTTTYSALRRGGVETIEELMKLYPDNIKKLRSIGDNQVTEIQEKLKKFLEEDK